VSWSFTAHRLDIGENNLLPVKARHACFVRAISEHGAAELRTHVLDSTWSPVVLHMGVRLPPPRAPGVPAGPSLRVLTAARFVEKKGHVHLLDALSLLLERGVAVRVELAGDGPLEPMLRRRVQELGLDRNVVFRGKVSHERLLRELAEGRWDASVLPSVVTASGELEGIPVSLIEAMASGVPAVGTASGGMPELLEGGAGILVPPGDPEALADALAALAADPAQRAALARKGRERVEDAFSVESVAAALAGRFRDCASGPTASRPAP
jgi:colanic acid/amylovoran biosynthesis glycosyltransferase